MRTEGLFRARWRRGAARPGLEWIERVETGFDVRRASSGERRALTRRRRLQAAAPVVEGLAWQARHRFVSLYINGSGFTDADRDQVRHDLSRAGRAGADVHLRAIAGARERYDRISTDDEHAEQATMSSTADLPADDGALERLLRERRSARRRPTK